MTTVTLQGKPFKTVGDPPEVGQKAPDFKLTTTSLEDITLKDFLDTPLIINSVPCLDTEICYLTSKKMEALAEHYQDVGFLTVSLDLPPTLKRISQAEQYTDVLLLSDFRTQNFGKTYGVKIKTGLLKGFLTRAIFILDREHQLVLSHVLSKIDAKPDFDEIEKIIQSL